MKCVMLVQSEKSDEKRKIKDDIIVNQAQNTEKYKYKIHTTETEATRSYIIIPASARARLAHDMTTGRSPATSSTIILLLKT